MRFRLYFLAPLLAACFCAAPAPASADIENLELVSPTNALTELDPLNVRLTFDTDEEEDATVRLFFRGREIPLECDDRVVGDRREYDCSGSAAREALLLLPPGRYPLVVEITARDLDTDEVTDTLEDEAVVRVVIPNVATLQEVVSYMAERSPAYIRPDLENPLSVKLRNVQRHLDRGRNKTARNVLNAFMNQVRAQSGKGIHSAAASKLLADARVLSNRYDGGNRGDDDDDDDRKDKKKKKKKQKRGGRWGR